MFFRPDPRTANRRALGQKLAQVFPLLPTPPDMQRLLDKLP